MQIHSVDIYLQRQPLAHFVATLPLRNLGDRLIVRCHGEPPFTAGYQINPANSTPTLRKKLTKLATERAVEGAHFMQNLLGRMAAMGEVE